MVSSLIVHRKFTLPTSDLKNMWTLKDVSGYFKLIEGSLVQFLILAILFYVVDGIMITKLKNGCFTVQKE